MKEALALWIVIQLLLIGTAYGRAHNPALDGTLKCDDSLVSAKRKIDPEWMYAFAPLALFTPDDPIVTKYCEKQL